MQHRKLCWGTSRPLGFPWTLMLLHWNPICLLLTVSCAAARGGILYIFVFCILYYTKTFLNQITLSYNMGAICPALSKHSCFCPLRVLEGTHSRTGWDFVMAVVQYVHCTVCINVVTFRSYWLLRCPWLILNEKGSLPGSCHNGSRFCVNPHRWQCFTGVCTVCTQK